MERELEQERVTIMAIPQEILGDPVRGGEPRQGGEPSAGSCQLARLCGSILGALERLEPSPRVRGFLRLGVAVSHAMRGPLATVSHASASPRCILHQGVLGRY